MTNTPFKAHTTSKTILADTVTPVGIYLRLRDRYPNSLLLESNEYGRRDNSYSFICCNPVASFVLDEEKLKIELPNQQKRSLDSNDRGLDLIAELDGFRKSFAEIESAHPFPVQGLFGYLSYDAVQCFEDLSFRPSTSSGQASESNPESEKNSIPLAHYQLFQNIIVFDHYHNQVIAFDHSYYGAESRLDEIVTIINHRDTASYDFQTVGGETSEMQDDEFLELVEKGKAHAQRGDTFQMVLSRKFVQEYRGDDFQVYRQLRALNPSPYLFYFDYGNFRIFGSSPEAQLLIKGDSASIQPIAGTYKRTGNDAEDFSAAQELKKDPKEVSEHVMLVDLARNDLSRHAREVEVADYQSIHFYSHVIHMVSQVTGKIANPEDKLKLVADTFPAGTLSGAPKFKAMQLIDKYEKSAREFYGGALGFIGLNGDFNHAIVIRSFLSRQNRLEFRAGAGVVVESNPEDELQEVYNKTNALRSAIKKTTENVQHN
jgi:anthranilate synthase component 1